MPLAVAVILGVCFWPAAVAAGWGWSQTWRRRSLDPDDGLHEPPGVPGYLVVAAVLTVPGAVLAGWAFSVLFRLI